MTNNQDIAAQISTAGWRQGSVVAAASLDVFIEMLDAAGKTKVEKARASGEVVPFVVSAWCDVVSRDFEAEPETEFILGMKIQMPDPGYSRLKSSRVLDTEVGASGSFLRLNQTLRVVLPRLKLMELERDKTCEPKPDQLEKVQRWLANRYARPTFATAFNERMRDTFERSPVKKALEKLSEHVYLRVNVTPRTDELSQGLNYTANFIFLTRHANLMGDPKLAQAFDVIRDALKRVNGVNVGVTLSRESEYSVAEYMTTQPYTLDVFSYSKTDGALIGLPAPKD